MAKFKVTTEDGTYLVETDDGSTPSVSQDTQQNQLSSSPSIFKKVYDSFSIPEQKSREGLGMIAKMMPETYTGDSVVDTVINTPRIAAETLADVAPGFISRGSLLASGGLKALQMASPAINAGGRLLGKTLESTSGLGYKTPGVLAKAVEDPTLLFGKGVDKARQMYSEVQNAAQVSPDLKGISNSRAFVMRALKMANEDNLTPDEALEARKALDSISDNVPDIFRKQTRTIFDAIAKQKFGEADAAYSRAIKSEALRSFWGINKGGTPSIVKGGVMMGVGQGVLSPFLSPVVQGAGASALGLTKMAASPLVNNPMTGFLSTPVLRSFRKNGN